jgi:hypothetical protein
MTATDPKRTVATASKTSWNWPQMPESDVLNLVQPEVTGGKITRLAIDEIASSSLSRLKVSGLRQDSFDYLVDTYGNRFREIEFWKCPRVTNLSRLSTLKSIESLSFYWNQQASRLWDMSANKRLKQLSFFDFTKLQDIDDLATSNSLKDVHFGNAVWPKMVVESLQPLVAISTLRKLHFEPKHVADGRVEPLSQIQFLEELEFPAKMFSTEKVAWLTARIGARVQSKVLCAVRYLEHPIPNKEKSLDALIIGKRKPMLDSNLDSKRLQKYVDKFHELTKYYVSNADECEPD